MKALAVITARAGSIGIKGKNLADLCGKPLIAYSIEAALACPEISRIIVTTDGDRIYAVAKECGAEVIRRPPELGTDFVSINDVVAHVLQELDGELDDHDALVLLQPTSPLRTSGDISSALSLLEQGRGEGSVISVMTPKMHPMKTMRLEDGLLSPWVDRETLGTPRQLLPDLVHTNGALYVTAVGSYLEAGHFYSEPIRPYFMPESRSVDVDSPADLELASYYLKLENHCR
ncbi:MAG: acylneuraminate cytidylyltransferase family protein [Candidatus Sedimenticola sp. PURPLELP]